MNWRNLARWGALIVGLAVLFWRMPDAIRNYHDWREVAVSDPSAAELYKTNFEMDTAGIAIAVGLGLTIFLGLK